MKWKNEVPNKTEFMKVNTINFLENEKYNSDLLHEKNVGKVIYSIQASSSVSENFPTTSRLPESGTDAEQIDKENIESRTKMETVTLTQSRIDYKGSAPKRYTTKCFIKPKMTPIWYTESLFLNIGSTKRTLEEKVYFKNQLIPFHWSEEFSTEVKTAPKRVLSEIYIPIDDEGIQYISFEPQQRLHQLVASTDL